MTDKVLFEMTYTLADIDIVARKYWEAVHGYTVFAFSGEMGAGKTTFIHHLCDYLNVADAVSSPTFALINEYHFDEENKDRTIYHMDWYRIKDSMEAVNAGIEDILLQAKNRATYCFVEWPEKAKELLPSPYVWITIAPDNDAAPEENKRKMVCTLHS